MGQDYDKILKENIEALILPLARRVLGLPEPVGMVDIADDLQRTIERRPDFVKIITDEQGLNVYILQVEFQTVDEPKMVYRMLEYAALLIRRYELPVRQYVCYIGSKKARMATRLTQPNLTFSFELRSLSDIAYSDFLETDQPEEAVLAVLGNLSGSTPEYALERIITVLHQLVPNKLDLDKFLVQLELLAKLRDLQDETIKQIDKMALVYDLETDIRYLQGKQKGADETFPKAMAHGFREGLEEGREQTMLNAVNGFLKLGVATPEQIAQALNVPVDLVLTLQAKQAASH